MSGSLFAGHDQSAGEIVEIDGKKYKEFYGMSSANAMNKYQDSSAAASPMLVSNNQSSSNTNNYASYNSRVTSTDTSTQNIVNQN